MKLVVELMKLLKSLIIILPGNVFIFQMIQASLVKIESYLHLHLAMDQL